MIIYCWIIPTTLEITQYKPSPDGRLYVKKPIINGIAKSIVFCVWSCILVVSLCIRKVLTTANNGSIKKGSGLLKLCSQKLFPKICKSGLYKKDIFIPGGSLGFLSALNSAHKIGSCISKGRHPASGLAPYCLYISITAIWAFCGSFLYFSWASLIFGCRACVILRDRICLTLRGYNAILITTVSRMMANP